MSRSYTSSPPKCLYGVLWDSFNFWQLNIVVKFNFNDRLYRFKNFKMSTYWKKDKRETKNKMERRRTWRHGRMWSGEHFTQ
jgi:hypothetical protein